MCGINGIVRFDGGHVEAHRIQAMNTAIQYRGPDDEGIYVDRHVGLGHLRLAILDLSAKGHQPMRYTHQGRTAILVYNGEIFNFEGIRSELQGKGYAFDSRSDTEVLLAAYFEYGVDCVRLFNGQFAFALYDADKNILFGARDRFGEKPFKYFLDDHQMIFSSELKAILADGVAREVDVDAIDDFLTLQYVPSPQTGFKNIHKLPHAHYFVLDIATGSLAITRYFDLDFSTPLVHSESEWLERLDHALLAAVERRMIADVPLGLFLSGGLDSSMIAAMMHRVATDVRTFSIAFDEHEYDESSFARAVAARFKTQHTEFKVRPGDLVEHITDLVGHYDEPYADNSTLPTFILSKLTRPHVTVALSGDAGDENFGGYEKHRLHALAWQYRGLLGALRPLAPAIDIGRGYPAVQRLSILLRTLPDPIATRHFNYTSFFDTRSKGEFYTPAFTRRLSPGRQNPFERVLGARTMTEIDKVLYVDFNSYLPDDINVKVDMASMRSSLEVRAPMLDHEFASLTAQIPWALKVDGRGGKKLFKTLADRYLPPDIVHRRKHGFGVPIREWLRGELRDLAHKTIFDPEGLVLQIMHRDRVTHLFDAHLRGADNATRLWALLVLNLWHRRFFLDRMA